MMDPYQPKLARISSVKKSAEKVKLFRLQFEQGQSKFNFKPGQFVMLSLPGFGEAPFAVCSSPFEKRFFELCIKEAGSLTQALHALKIGDKVGIRGPYGKGWPLKKNQNYLLVAGGLGLVPLRPLILAKDKLLGKKSKVQVFYGCKCLEDLIFKDEYQVWRKKIDLVLTLEKKCVDWLGCVGLITDLFSQLRVPPSSQCFMVGPPVMYKFVLKKLMASKFKDENIYLSLERRMHCGVGVCQHCAVDSKYVCQDGPVFNYKEAKEFIF